jgi:type IV secretion system protein VirB10
MNRARLAYLGSVGLFLLSVFSASSFAQEPAGPQTSAPPPVAPAVRPAAQRRSAASERITVPAGTRVAVVLENGVSTGSAKAGDSLYFRTSFPITQNNRIVIPVGCYLRGEVLETKRPGRIKGRGEFRMRLNTLIFPNGYTVDLNAAPRSADTGGRETMDPEGKVTGPGGKGKDAGTVAATTVTGAGIGAIAGGAKGAGIGAGAGGLLGLGAILLTRGPEAELPRGSALDIVFEHALVLDSSQIQYTNVGNSSPITPPMARPH